MSHLPLPQRPATEDALDVLIALGLVASGGAIGYYGEIYASDVADELTISGSGQANRILITSFAVNGESSGVTLDQANNLLTLDNAGVYKVEVSLAVTGVGGSSAEFGFAVYKNTTVELVNMHAHRNVAAGGGDTGSVSLSGLARFVAADTLKVFTWNEDNTSNIIVDDISLSAFRVGD